MQRESDALERSMVDVQVLDEREHRYEEWQKCAAGSGGGALAVARLYAGRTPLRSARPRFGTVPKYNLSPDDENLGRGVKKRGEFDTIFETALAAIWDCVWNGLEETAVKSPKKEI